MTLPDLSNAMYVAGLRYIQSIHEPPERRNPDTLVRHFLPITDRWRKAWLRRQTLSDLRADPFYYYLIARTRYYDHVVTDAVSHGARAVLSIGCGTDTRAYRFHDLLSERAVSVLECDQAAAIAAKQRRTKRWRSDHVEYSAIDLNDDAQPALESWLGDRRQSKALVVMEGVSPYVNDTTFSGFLRLLATLLSPDSQVAYDFKFRGANDDFGRVGRTCTPFRLPEPAHEIASFHFALGLRVVHLEASSALCARLLPDVAQSHSVLFTEDCLVRLAIAGI